MKPYESLWAKIVATTLNIVTGKKKKKFMYNQRKLKIFNKIIILTGNKYIQVKYFSFPTEEGTNWWKTDEMQTYKFLCICQDSFLHTILILYIYSIHKMCSMRSVRYFIIYTVFTLCYVT